MIVDLENRLDAHFVSAIGVLVEHVGDGGVRADRDGIVVTAMGRGGAEFNTAMVTGSMRDPEASIAWACEALEGRGSSSMVQVPKAFCDERLEAALRACDRQLAEVIPGMVCEVSTEVAPLPEGLRIEHVTDQDGLDAHSVATAANFGAPEPRTAVGLFPTSLIDDPRVAMFNGYVDERSEPVATAVSVVIDGVAGVYAITAHPGVRRRGIGAAMTWAAMQVGAQKGADLAVLQATAMGRPVYTGMGFRAVRDYLRFTPAEGHAG